MAFPRWISKLILCFKNSNDRFSPVFCTIRCPMSLSTSLHSVPMAHMFRILVARKEIALPARDTLALFFSSAFSAAAPARTVERARWDAARVSMQVTSQTKLIPRVHGTSVIPSGRRSFSIHQSGRLQNGLNATSGQCAADDFVQTGMTTAPACRFCVTAQSVMPGDVHCFPTAGTGMFPTNCPTEAMCHCYAEWTVVEKIANGRGRQRMEPRAGLLLGTS